MDGAVSEVDQLLGVSGDERGVATVVAGIGGGGCVSTADRVRQRGIDNVAGPSAIAAAHELAVPTVGGVPDFDLDFGVGGGADDRCDSAEGGELSVGVRLGGVLVGQGESAGGDGLGFGDGGRAEREGG